MQALFSYILSLASERQDADTRRSGVLAVLLAPIGLVLGFLFGLLASWFIRSRRSPTKPDVQKSAEAEEPDSEVDASGETPPSSDDLTQIYGIGPVFRRRLNVAGITTFGQLASMSPDKLQRLLDIDVDPQRIIDDDWIGQAAALADDEVD